MADRIQVRRDTAANWTSADPTLAAGELGYETDTGKIKLGDGSTAWTSLAYWGLATADLEDLADATITSIASGEILVWNGSAWVNQTFAEAALMGKQTIWVPASAMTPATTSGAASEQVEETTNKHNYATLDFDTAADEYACFEIPMPKSWDLGTITFKVVWSTSGAVSTGIAFALQGVAVADGDNSDVAYGTAVVVTDDAQGAVGDVLISAESGAVTIAGSPAAGELCQFRVFRDVSDANDDMTQDMQLRGIRILYNNSAMRDD